MKTITSKEELEEWTAGVKAEISDNEIRYIYFSILIGAICFLSSLTFLSILSVFLLSITFILFVKIFLNKETIKSKSKKILILLVTGGIPTIWSLVSTFEAAKYQVKPENITFIGNPENRNEIHELIPGKHLINHWQNFYIFPQQKTYSWELIIRPGKDALHRGNKNPSIFLAAS